jgi:hypothetical protein
MFRHICNRAAAAVLLSALTPVGWALPQENCIFEISPPEEPYYVLGSRVVPQSNYLVVADCSKTAEEVRAGLLASARERAGAAAAVAAEAEARERRARAEGEALERARRQAREAAAEDEGMLPRWWNRIWR